MLTRFLPDGRIDRTFGYAGMVQSRVYFRKPHAVDVLSDGSAVMVTEDDDYSTRVLRYRRDGAPDLSWGSGGAVRVPGMRIVHAQAAPGGDVFAAGTVMDEYAVARLRGGRLAGDEAPAEQPNELPGTEPPPAAPPPVATSREAAKLPGARRPPALRASLRGRRLVVRLSARDGFRGRIVVRRAGRVVATRTATVPAGRARTVRVALARRWPALTVQAGSSRRVRVVNLTATHG